MSDNRKQAAVLLSTAGKTILKDRPGIHGSAENSFEMIGDLWTVYLRHARRVRGVDTIRPEDVAEMMAMLKKARKIYGDPMNVDNDVDDIGYTALSGMLRLPDPDKSMEEQLSAMVKPEQENKAEAHNPETEAKTLTLDEQASLGGGKPAVPTMRHTNIAGTKPAEDTEGFKERSPGEILKSLYGLGNQDAD